MLIKKRYLLVCIVLMMSKSALVSGDDLNYLVFDKILFGTFTCKSPSDETYNMICPKKYLQVSGWVRDGSDGVPVEISEVTMYAEVSGNIFSSSLDDTGYGLKECEKAINLVKSNPGKWDLKVGRNSYSIVYCEVFNQLLMQQYYAEQE